MDCIRIVSTAECQEPQAAQLQYSLYLDSLDFPDVSSDLPQYRMCSSEKEFPLLFLNAVLDG